MNDFPDASLPLDYGEPQAEAWSLRHGCGVILGPSADRLILRGEDGRRFLNGQITCDVSDLAPGKGIYGFLTTVKGRIEADATVLAQEDHLLLVLPPGLGAAIRERLERYIIVDRVEIAEPAPSVRLSFLGPGAEEALAALLGVSVPAEVWGHRPVELEGRSGWLIREGRLGKAAWSLWLPESAAEEVLGRLAEAADCRRIGQSAFEAFRVEVGMSRFGQDFGPENLPQETGIEEAISYSKGCYLGQEVVARLHYRGQVSRQLRRLELSTSQVPSLPSELSLEGRSAGRLTSAAALPEGETAFGIGLIQRRAFEPGTELELSTGGTATVRGLPSD